MRVYEERCDECSARAQCARHVACATLWDARLAADIGIGWARFVWRQVDARQPWPPCTGRCAEIAERLVTSLASTPARRGELAELCSWRAGITWDALTTRHRDAPYRQTDGGGLMYPLPGHPHIEIRFRPRGMSRVRSAELTAITEAALTRQHLRVRRFQGALAVDHDAAGQTLRARTRR